MAIFVMQVHFAFTWLGIGNGFFQRTPSETELIAIGIHMVENIVRTGFAKDFGGANPEILAAALFQYVIVLF